LSVTNVSAKDVRNFSFGCLLLFTLGGNKFVSNYLAHWLEASFTQIDIPRILPLDAMLVLGGGTRLPYWHFNAQSNFKEALSHLPQTRTKKILAGVL
jgi:hypothetical protein